MFFELLENWAAPGVQFGRAANFSLFNMNSSHLEQAGYQSLRHERAR